MVGIGQRINLAFCKHSSSGARGSGAGRSPRTDVAHWFAGKSNTPSDFLAADLHFLAVLSKGLISGVNLMFLNKRTNAHTRHEGHTFSSSGTRTRRRAGLPGLFHSLFFLAARLIGKRWHKCVVLDLKKVGFLCTVSPLPFDSSKVIAFISATNPVFVCQTSSQSGQALKFTTSDSCDRIKDEFQFLQAQYHRCCHTHTHTHTPLCPPSLFFRQS